MLWLKRIFCGFIGLFLILWGVLTINNVSVFWQFFGFIILAGGIALIYIAVKQTLPSYSFWITLVAIGLAYALLVDQKNTGLSQSEADRKAFSVSEELGNQKTAQRISKKKKKNTGVNLSAYPRISGSVTVIHAHVFYIGGRYVRLFGVDAPDNDQLCSDSIGRSYNCGEYAASWVRNWIDKNPIDCYILKVEPKGKDSAICVWGKYDIGAGLVGAGWALAKTTETNIYKPYEIKAQNDSSGLWEGDFYSPEDWRNIKRKQNDFTIKSNSGGFFKFGSWFK